jgi:hypothetical protein
MQEFHGALDEMPELTSTGVDLNALGQVIDDTFGRSHEQKTSQYYVKMRIHGGALVVDFKTMVNFGSQQDMIRTKRKYTDEAKSITNQALARVKKCYKEVTGKALKLKESGTDDRVDIINVQSNKMRTACYTFSTFLEIG